MEIITTRGDHKLIDYTQFIGYTGGIQCRRCGESIGLPRIIGGQNLHICPDGHEVSITPWPLPEGATIITMEGFKYASDSLRSNADTI